MLEKVTKPYHYSALGLAIVNLVLCLLTFGKRVWYDAYFNRYTYEITLERSGSYSAKVLDATTIGTIFFALCCLVIVLGAVLLILKLVKKIDKKELKIAFSGLSLVTGVFGIIAYAASRKFILKYIVMTKWTGTPGDYVESYFISGGIVLHFVLVLSILMVVYSAVELVNCLITKNKNVLEGTVSVE